MKLIATADHDCLILRRAIFEGERFELPDGNARRRIRSGYAKIDTSKPRKSQPKAVEATDAAEKDTKRSTKAPATAPETK